MAALLSAAGLQSPIIAIEPHSAVVRVGETATFRCRVYSGAQPVRLEWKVANNQQLSGNNHTFVKAPEEHFRTSAKFTSVIVEC